MPGNQVNRTAIGSVTTRCRDCGARLIVDKNWYQSSAERNDRQCMSCRRDERFSREHPDLKKPSYAKPERHASAPTTLFTIKKRIIVSIPCAHCGKIATELDDKDVHAMAEMMLAEARKL